MVLLFLDLKKFAVPVESLDLKPFPYVVWFIDLFALWIYFSEICFPWFCFPCLLGDANILAAWFLSLFLLGPWRIPEALSLLSCNVFLLESSTYPPGLENIWYLPDDWSLTQYPERPLSIMIASPRAWEEFCLSPLKTMSPGHLGTSVRSASAFSSRMILGSWDGAPHGIRLPAELGVCFSSPSIPPPCLCALPLTLTLSHK